MVRTLRETIGDYERASRRVADQEQVTGSNIVTEQVKAVRNNVVYVAFGEEVGGEEARLSANSVKKADNLSEAFESEAQLLSWLMCEVKLRTGMDVDNAVLTDDLPTGVAGRYHRKSGQIELRRDLMGDPAKLLHVAIHEALHAKLKTDGQISLDFEEGLVERRATELARLSLGDGQSLAYEQEQRDADKVISLTNYTQSCVNRAIDNGDTQTLVEIEQTALAKEAA